MNELITVLMPVYNAEKYIVEAVQSVLDQTYREFKLLVVNDGCTDRSIEIIRDFKDSRIRIIEQPRQGISAALNNGLKQCNSKYVMRFDADDICMPARLEKQLHFLEKNPEYVLVGCDAEYISENGEFLFNYISNGHSHEDIIRELPLYSPLIHSGVTYIRTAVIDAGGYSPWAHTFEDYLLWVNLSRFGLYFNIPEVLIKVRINPGSVTIDEKWRGRNFRKLKRDIIRKGFATTEEGKKLEKIIEQQRNSKIMKGAYYALCGKKFLVNNYQPGKARKYLKKAAAYHPFRADNYALYILSFFPKAFISWLHKLSPNRI